MGVYDFTLRGYRFMEAILRQQRTFDIASKVKEISEMCRISRIEKLVSDSLETLYNSSPFNYIGELNKNDVMH